MTSTARFYRKVMFLFTAFIFISSIQAFAERLGFSGYTDLSLDLPESFQLIEKSADQKSYQLSNSEFPVNLIIKLYSQGKYGSSQRAMDDSISKLKLRASSSPVNWRNQQCTFATVTGSLNSTQISGYSASCMLPWDKGSIFVFTWCNASDKAKYDNFMLSILDSLCIDAGSYFEAGIVTAHKYPLSSASVQVNLSIDGKQIVSSLNAVDSSASSYLIEREYAVLCLYQKSPNWKEAWQRYYRMIFKDSYKRIEKCAFDIYSALESDCIDETDLAQKLLTWTQGFEYQREKTASDFASLPSMLTGGGSDCDSRSLLLAVLLYAMNQDTVIFVSNQYAHAMAGFVSSHPGHSFTSNGKQYLMGETTATGLTWGKISATMDNQANWITVSFP